jgi:uncharacterized membrane protein YfcA
MGIEMAIVGLLVGFLVGLTGVGGASLLTPFLIVGGIEPSIAIGTDFIYNSITKLFGTIQHWKQKTINLPLMKYLALGSIPSCMMAIGTLHFFPTFYLNQEQIIKHALGYVLILVAISIIVRVLYTPKSSLNRWQKQSLKQKRGLAILIGIIFGFIVGLTSVGSGSLFAIAMLYLYKMNTAELVGTDIAHAFLLMTVAGILNASLGTVDYILVGNLLLGSIPGVILGSRLSTKVPTKPLRVVLAILILISGISLLN